MSEQPIVGKSERVGFDVILRSIEFPEIETHLGTVHCDEDELTTVVGAMKFFEARYRA